MSLILFLCPLTSWAADDSADASAEEYAAPTTKATPYVFSWPGHEGQVTLRGGTTKGPETTLLETPSEAWIALQEADLDPKERDRRAILALAGDYRTSFDFLETEVFSGDGKPAKPYRSWGTERVHVVQDDADRIVLQHIMTMYIIDDDGNRSEPIVMKHWRQDWQWQPSTLLSYEGMDQFVVREVSESDRAGRWSQTAYQVDDSPRYAMIGTWNHSGSFSEWVSDPAWRPLPRRERSVRDDYQVLGGWNRITVNPTGWVHFQDNVKTVLTEPGVEHADAPVVAREIGVNRYQRIVDFAFGPGDTYWAATAPYWEMVRETWQPQIDKVGTFVAHRTCDEKPVFAAFFDLATPLAQGKRLKAKRTQREIDAIVACMAE
ncbi:MAG: DUF6607 family protein [Myxococcota bacterium]